jgi:hypothetical protein
LAAQQPVHEGSLLPLFAIEGINDPIGEGSLRAYATAVAFYVLMLREFN